jgi:DNA polymerase-3 subunit gamma/tau
MSYQVLARKYRPKNFDTLVGQEHVVRALTHALQTGRLHHAYLFTGTRGVGKTTLSRILAKSFNCLGADGQGGVTDRACGVCSACVAIDGGRFVDYIEMDAASNRGVDEMAQLLEQAVYAPSNARFKVYMIDEVHMLTNTAFNSMLKTLEEPPPHIKFILATTDPQKIPVTVLSRCLQFNLKQMPPGHIIDHLTNILSQEQIEFETPALRLLAQGAHGSMRDALSLTDQAIAYAAGAVTLSAVQGMLGALDSTFLVRIIDALVEQNGAALLALCDEMAGRSLSFHTALQDLASLLHKIAIAQTVPQGIPDDWPERDDIVRLAGLLDAEEVQLFYQIVLHGKQELGLAPDEYAGFSMTLLRMLAFRPDGVAQQASSVPPARAAGAAGAVRAAAPAGAAASTAGLGGAASGGTTAGGAAAAATPGAGATRPPAPAATPAYGAGAPAASTGERMSPAKAALEAARNASGRGAGSAPAAQAMAPAPAAPAISPATSSVNLATPSAVAAPAAAPAAAHAAALAPNPPPRAAAQAAPPEPPGDDVPPWLMMDDQVDFGPAQKKTEFDAEPARPSTLNRANQQAGDAALRVAAQAAAKAAARATAAETLQSGAPMSEQAAPAAPAAPTQELAPPFVAFPLENWDGDWPTLSAQLPVRGVIRELATQTELSGTRLDGGTIELQLRCELETLASPANLEKLSAALSEHFAKPVRIKPESGKVWHSAAIRAEAARQVRQKAAEESILNDPFVKSIMREFGAIVVPDSVKPVALAQMA